MYKPRIFVYKKTDSCLKKMQVCYNKIKLQQIEIVINS